MGRQGEGGQCRGKTSNGNDKWKLPQMKYWKSQELQGDLKTERIGTWSSTCDSKYNNRWLDKR